MRRSPAARIRSDFEPDDVDLLACVCLVACVAFKLSRPAPACELYTSQWFKLARGFAERCGNWFVLSAHHKLIRPCSVIEPYDKVMSQMNPFERAAWARAVAYELKANVRSDVPVILLAGRFYRDPLLATDVFSGRKVSCPLAHLSIGKQLAWMSQRGAKGAGAKKTATTVAEVRRWSM